MYLDKIGFGHIIAEYFTNSSCHPGPHPAKEAAIFDMKTLKLDIASASRTDDPGSKPAVV
jgi:hypothetical protein